MIKGDKVPQGAWRYSGLHAFHNNKILLDSPRLPIHYFPSVCTNTALTMCNVIFRSDLMGGDTV